MKKASTSSEQVASKRTSKRASNEGTGKTVFVGIDAHKEKLVVHVLPPEGQALTFSARHREDGVRKLVRELKKLADGAEIRACYEAGPTGFGLKRQLEAASIVCEVVAPSLIPKKPGDHVKTDRRDAKNLAELMRAGVVTEVQAPTADEESIRELCRARLRAGQDLAKARNKLGKMLLRNGRVFEGRPWTQAHTKWLAGQRFANEPTTLVFEDLVAECVHLEGRVKRLDAHIEQYAQGERYATAVGALCCLRGVRVLTAMVLVTELFRFKRFESPRALMSYVGLTPSEHSSGDRTQRGSITKAGNQHVRRLLVEAAKHARKENKQSLELGRRRAGQRADVVAIAERAQERLNRRYWRLVNGGKHPNKATVAVARELAGFVWAILRSTAADGHPVAA